MHNRAGWSAPTAGGPVIGYRIEHRVGNSTWWKLVLGTGKAIRDWVDRTVAAVRDYGHRMAAHNWGVQEDWSLTGSMTTAVAPTNPGAPLGLAVTAGMDSRPQLNWTPPAATGGVVTGYRIKRSLDTLPCTGSEVVAAMGSAAVGGLTVHGCQLCTASWSGGTGSGAHSLPLYNCSVGLDRTDRLTQHWTSDIQIRRTLPEKRWQTSHHWVA